MKHAEIPVFIAVTGHRDIKDPNETTRHLCAFFSQLKSAMPHTMFHLMSGLAAGADQLFIDCGRKVLGAQAQAYAVLPFKREEYQKDFTGRDLNSYLSLLSTAENVIELPGSRDNEPDAYFAVGKYLAENANMMVAIWDGNTPYDKQGKRIFGGTSDVANYWLNNEKFMPIKLFSSHSINNLIRIPASRVDNPSRVDREYIFDDPNENRHGKILDFSEKDAPDAFLKRFFSVRETAHAFEQIDPYNAQCQKDDPARERSKKYLGITDFSGVEKLMERYSVLDASANEVQKKYVHQFNVIFTLSLLLGICAQIYGGVPHTFLAFHINDYVVRPITCTLPCYFFLFVLVFLYSYLQKLGECDNKYLDYRALAEVLRVNIFWRIVGISDHPKDYFLTKSSSNTEWISVALHNWDLLDADERAAVPHNTTDVTKAWIADQRKYYAKKSKLLNAQTAKVQRIAKFSFMFSIFMGIIFFIDTFIYGIIPNFMYDPMYEMNGILVGFGSFLMASLMFLIEKKGWDETAASYEQNEKLFDHILNCMDGVDAENGKIYLRFLGKEAIKEHEEWLKRYRQRKPEPNV